MIKLRTASGTEFPLEWIGISDFDGSLRFEVTSPAGGDRVGLISTLFSIFSDPAETAALTRIYDEDEKVFENFTVFKGLELMATGNIVVRLLRE